MGEAMLEKDECNHRYLSSERNCQTCGMRFRQVWPESRYGMWQPALRMGLFSLAAFVLTAYIVGTGGGLPAAIMVAVTVFLLTRSVMCVTERYVPRQFRVGTLDYTGLRNVLSVFAHKPLVAHVAGIRFQLDSTVSDRLKIGDTVLVEFTRWTRLPTVWYQGQ